MGFSGKSSPSLLFSVLTAFPSMSHWISFVEPIRAVETQLVNALPVAGAGSVVIGLHNGQVLAQELEVDLVLRFAALEGGEVEVEVEAAGVPCRTLNEGAEGAVEEPRGGSPPSAAAMVEASKVRVMVLELGQWVQASGV
jgi:hypothetical protein